MNETDLQRAILQALSARGWWAQRMNAGSRRVQSKREKREYMVRLAPPGTPDILVLKPYGWLEVKTAMGELRASQALWHRAARSRGVRVATVRSISEALQTVQFWADSDHGLVRACPVAKCPLEET
jgi:hypothetical protein